MPTVKPTVGSSTFVFGAAIALIRTSRGVGRPRPITYTAPVGIQHCDKSYTWL